ncbi:MAG: signal recognition particle protein, partial [Alphaproteobacteria bacterium HGW-Alphaproteobacteria-8]
MFESLSERLSGVFDKLTKQGALSEADVSGALREVRMALLDADVALPVARDFIEKVREKATGAAVLKSVTPGQQVVKIVHDELVRTLSGDEADEGLKIDSPPAAMEQLAVLGVQIGVDTLPIVKGQDAVAIAKRAKQQASFGGYDVLMLDTAGRLHVDDALMAEVEAVRDVTRPNETLLVVDSLTGQDAVNVAQNFNTRVGVTGVVLTRMDGDGRGGAALSMRAVTGRPIKFIGAGEKMDALEEFHPNRVAGRILGMG